MSDKAKLLIVKTSIVAAIFFLLNFLVNPILGLELYNWDDATFEFRMKINFGLFLCSAVVMMLLISLIKPKGNKTKADKMVFSYKTYDALMEHLYAALLANCYEKRQPISLAEGEVTLFTKPEKRKHIGQMLNCFTIVRLTEATNENIEESQNTITEILQNYYGKKTLREPVDMISVICVDRVTPAFSNLVNSPVKQGFKNGRLVIGVSFGGKQIYIAPSNNGFGKDDYKRMRSHFLDVMNMTELEKDKTKDSR